MAIRRKMPPGRGALIARNIVRSLRGEPPREFRYRPIGELALVGKRSGVAQIYGYNFSGLTAWLMWRVIYLAKMPGAVRRIQIAADWITDALFVDHSAVRTAPEAVSREASAVLQ